MRRIVLVTAAVALLGAGGNEQPGKCAGGCFSVKIVNRDTIELSMRFLVPWEGEEFSPDLFKETVRKAGLCNDQGEEDETTIFGSNLSSD